MNFDHKKLYATAGIFTIGALLLFEINKKNVLNYFEEMSEKYPNEPDQSEQEQPKPTIQQSEQEQPKPTIQQS